MKKQRLSSPSVVAYLIAAFILLVGGILHAWFWP